MKYYYILRDNPDIVFYDEIDALEYDIKINPNLHKSKRKSFIRWTEVIKTISEDDLTMKQREYLRVHPYQEDDLYDT